MSIIVSSEQSEEYSKYYGKRKQDFLADGFAMSDPALVKGSIRTIADTIVVENTIPVGANVFAWKFQEDVSIVSGALVCTGAVGGSGQFFSYLLNEDSENGVVIYPAVYDPIITWTGFTIRNIRAATPVRNIPKGAVLSFEANANPILLGVVIEYSLTFASSL